MRGEGAAYRCERRWSFITPRLAFVASSAVASHPPICSLAPRPSPLVPPDELRPHPLPPHARDRCRLARGQAVLRPPARPRRTRAVVDRVSEELLSGASDRLPAALLPRGAVQDPVVVDAAHARRRRLHPGQQVRLRPAAAD